VRAVHRLGGSLCRCCGEACGAGFGSPAAAEPVEFCCGLCQRAHPPFERAVAYGSYDGALRDLIHLLKFHQIRPAAPVLGHMLADVITALEPVLPAGQITVIPVPLHAKKQAQRGFNQAEVIARAALKDLSQGDAGRPFDVSSRVLVRSRETGSQIGLTRHQRRQNLRGAFAIKDATAISNATVLLVDDVYTTGATASECARILLKAGAARVWVATVARTMKIFNSSVLPEDSYEDGHNQEEEAASRLTMAAQG